MNRQHEKTLAEIFRRPTSMTLEWRRVEALLLTLGAVLQEGSGSRVSFELNGIVATFHRPHPRKESPAYQVRAVREFLTKAGIHP